MKVFAAIFVSLVFSQAGAFDQVSQKDPKLPLDKITLPKGFKISLFAVVPGARSLAISPNGTVFVGSTSNTDKLYRVRDTDSDMKADSVEVLDGKMDWPNGVAFKDGKLYVAEVDRIFVFDNAEVAKEAKEFNKRTLPQKFPSDTHHGWKFIRFGPDGQLYVPVGAPCNICDPKKDYARLFRLDVAGTAKTEVAEGIRNTVGFDFHPITKELWFTDNGRDWLGDDQPPDELNRLAKVGQHFGYPYCHGKTLQDPEFKDKPCSQFTPPVAELRAHVAALGMRFYTGSSFPGEYKNQIFIAEHGSWNRSKPQGYRVTLARLKDSDVVSTEGFAEGWLQNNGAWGRPVDVEIYKDGSLLVSDDKAGVIYRISTN